MIDCRRRHLHKCRCARRLHYRRSCRRRATAIPAAMEMAEGLAARAEADALAAPAVETEAAPAAVATAVTAAESATATAEHAAVANTAAAMAMCGVHNLDNPCLSHTRQCAPHLARHRRILHRIDTDKHCCTCRARMVALAVHLETAAVLAARLAAAAKEE